MKMLSVCTVLCCFGVMGVLHANKAIIHNETNYPMTVDWHTTSTCRFQPNVSIPANKVTEITWGICNSTSSIWNATIGINPTKNVVTVDDETHYGFSGERVWHVTAETPKSRVPDPMNPTRYYDVEKGVRFTIKVDPSGHMYKGGTYKGPWFDATSGVKLTNDKIAEYGLPK